MKKLLPALGIVALLFVVGWTGYGQKQGAPRITWEYRIEGEGSTSNRQVNLAAIGAEGWELTAVTTGEEVVGGIHYATRTYYFKRPK